jgi:hypothetical protein
MSWHRPGRSLGRSGLVGTTVRAGDRRPRHLVADERPTTPDGRKVSPAATAGGGRGPGLGGDRAGLAPSPDPPADPGLADGEPPGDLGAGVGALVAGGDDPPP